LFGVCPFGANVDATQLPGQSERFNSAASCAPLTVCAGAAECRLDDTVDKDRAVSFILYRVE
jgi:hypothetical protein